MIVDQKILLTEEEIPKQWYNIQADMPEPLDPMLHPETHEPTQLPPFLFSSELNRQEFSKERWIDIPEEIRDVYRIWRPSPLYRATRLEKALKTPAKIYYKWEGVSPPGSHKPNTAIAQAYYNMKEGIERLTTETGAGQWGSSLAFATKLFDLECMVYMVRVSYQQKPYRKSLMHIWGAEVVPSPSNRTQTGQKLLEKDPDSPGSLGVAISEAVEDAATNENSHYTLGSVLNHVVLHQTIMGLEAKQQFAKIDLYPDAIYGCVGGGSNFAGAAFPFLGDKLRGERKDLDVVACEPAACPTLTKGLYEYDFGDSVGLAPIVKMYTLGHDFIPPKIHAGGLRYHGDSPLLSRLTKDGYIRAEAYHQTDIFDAAMLFAHTEGFVIAPETAHAVKGVIDEAKRCKETGEEKTIFFLNSGHGHFDLSSYDAYFEGKLVDYEYPAELVKRALENLPKVG
ncbi:MAG: tryptophan synthase subunit beta [Candidatus Syntrophoarchaeum caldarius]|uniref:Tryptophan synthase beta chain n=1 Tax=Candidatus Syntropharchaeum caldarium TaxID=1838285 RepID=A0A1F2PC72_9EURY|nr:MAG: tryptophan synthase subunit beta [Candidatus Syntrophoarchaeum caldarius]